MLDSAQIAPLEDAVKRISAKTPVGAILRSAEWANEPLAIRERSLWSAQVLSAQFVSDMGGKLGARIGMFKEAVAHGDVWQSRERFIGDMQAIARDLGVETAPGQGGIRDIRSIARLGLIYDFQTQQAHEYARWKMGQDTDAVSEFPAYRFARVEDRKKPRPEPFWPQRWAAAGGKTGWVGALKGPMVALKSSPIWMALSKFGTPFAPFDWGSGWGLIEVERKEAERLGLVKPGEQVAGGEAGFNDKVEASLQGVGPELRSKLQESGVAIVGDKAKMIKNEPEPVMKKEPEPIPDPLQAKRDSLKAETKAAGFDLDERIDHIPNAVIRAAPNLPKIVPDAEKAFYTAHDNAVHMLADRSKWYGHPLMFDHEYGHSVHTQTKAITAGGEVDATLAGCMREDYAAWKKAAKAEYGFQWRKVYAKKNVYSGVVAHLKASGLGDFSAVDMATQQRVAGFTDTIGGLSEGKYGAGHTKEKYKAQAGVGGKREVYSNLYRGIVNGWTEYEINFPLTATWIRSSLGL